MESLNKEEILELNSNLKQCITSMNELNKQMHHLSSIFMVFLNQSSLRGSMPFVDVPDNMTQMVDDQVPIEKEEVKSMSKEEENLFLKGKVIAEIIETEKDYVENLKTIRDLYKNPLKESKILLESEIEVLFSNVETLINIHEKYILEKVTAQLGENKDYTNIKIADIFSQFAEPLKEYQTYCTSHVSALFLLDDLKEDSNFVQFVRSIYRVPRNKNYQLSTWLIIPIQRLCKYPLLFKQLLRYIEEDKEEYEKVLEVEKSIKETVQYVNDKQKDAELETEKRKKEIIEIQNRLLDDVNLVKYGRKIHKAGVITVLNRRKNSFNETYLVIFTDLILLAKLKKGDKLKIRSLIQIQNVKLTDMGMEQDLSCLEVCDISSNEVQVLVFNENDSKYEWLTAIRTQYSAFLSQQIKRAGGDQWIKEKIDAIMNAVDHRILTKKENKKIKNRKEKRKSPMDTNSNKITTPRESTTNSDDESNEEKSVKFQTSENEENTESTEDFKMNRRRVMSTSSRNPRRNPLVQQKESLQKNFEIISMEEGDAKPEKNLRNYKLRREDSERTSKRTITKLTLDIINDLPKYDYEYLKTKPDECDRSILEMYLSNEDFEKLFKMTKEQWIPTPDFRKEFLKKQLSLW